MAVGDRKEELRAAEVLVWRASARARKNAGADTNQIASDARTS
jgi:hypothetical protein